MTTLEAVLSMNAQLALRRVARQPYQIEGIDFELCDDGKSVVAYAWLDGDEEILIEFDLPAGGEAFDRDLMRLTFLGAVELSRALSEIRIEN